MKRRRRNPVDGYTRLSHQLAGVIAGAVAGRYLRDQLGYEPGTSDGKFASLEHDATIMGGVAGYIAASVMEAK